jgi:hypothetical protein
VSAARRDDSRSISVTVSLEDPDAPIVHKAPLTCPSCGHEFTGRWVGLKTGTQRCAKCRHAFEATWPGFHFKPVTVIISREEAEARGLLRARDDGAA